MPQRQHTRWAICVRHHPGSSAEEIANEPNWSAGHNHRVGFRNRDNRIAGITHHDPDAYAAEIEQAGKDLEYLRKEAKEGYLVNFRNDFHLRHPEDRSLGWRYVLDTTEDWIKNQEKWPANIQLAEKDKEKNEKKDGREGKAAKREVADGQPEKDVTADQGHDSENSESENEHSPQEMALLKALKAEKDSSSQIGENDGKGRSPQTHNRTQLSIGEQDQFSPDNWLPRSPDLIRLTGKHPLNAEAKLDSLFAGGLITPNELHYVRNHGAVPRLLWEFHRLGIEHDGKKMTLTMDALKTRYKTINIPSSGFNWGPGAVGCAYWNGPLLRDLLLSAGVPEHIMQDAGGEKQHWVNFEGADELREGRYATCITFEYVMNPANDVILAYEMNDLPLLPDHGYPVRVVIPGYVGGRCVKWLRRIWISDRENDSHNHIWDNRVLPSVVEDKNTPLAEALFRQPDTACDEQMLNSVIARPAQGERVTLADVRKGHTYRVAGYAYAGCGHKVQRVEASLDGGRTWLYCVALPRSSGPLR